MPSFMIFLGIDAGAGPDRPGYFPQKSLQLYVIRGCLDCGS